MNLTIHNTASIKISGFKPLTDGVEGYRYITVKTGLGESITITLCGTDNELNICLPPSEDEDTPAFLKRQAD